MTKRARRKKNQSAQWVDRVSEAVTNVTSQTQGVVSEAWQDLEHERRREIMAIPLVALAAISLLALLSFNPTDLLLHESPIPGQEAQIQNWIGYPGACIAEFIIQIFGAPGYCLPALLLLWGIDRFFKGAYSPARKFRILGCIILLISTSSLMGILTEMMNPEIDATQLWRITGGFGFYISRRLLDFGPVGALIVNGTVISIALLLSTPFLFTDFFQRLSIFLFSPRVRKEMPDTEVKAIEILDADYKEDDFDDDDIREVLSKPQRGGLELKPLKEMSDSSGSYEPEPEPDIVFHDEVDKINSDESQLPPIGVTVENTGQLKIVTKEDEPTQEIDLGVNLIETPDNNNYQLPSITLLQKSENNKPEVARDEIYQNSQTLVQALQDFNIPTNVVEVNYGPTITCYELEPAPGIKISRIENLANDITRSLKAETVRIVAPIPGKGTVGVEVPNQHRSDVFLRDIIGCEKYNENSSKLKMGLGKTISGAPFVFDLIKAPHLLVAGATGSGKSVCINTMITSLLYNAAPHELKLLLVDPKQVELALYKDIPHLLSPVVTDPNKAGAALRWAVEEMEQRYRYLKKAGVRNIKEYNKKRMAQQQGETEEDASTLVLPGFLPYVVIIIDELADLMMVARVEVEASIARLAAMARAVGIHLVLATQRPSVDVLTGVIKNNFPARIAFQVSSTADSRTILDMKGADTLMGRGDMLLAPAGGGKPVRLQCSYVSTEEVEDIVEFVKSQQEVEYVQEEFTPIDDGNKSGSGADDGTSEEDELYQDALQVVLENDAASTSLLQRRLKIGYGRAARLLDLMEERGIVGPPRGSKPREVVLNKV
jgi:S-DNA-T family DNA segregation ATPase FtsK/SpoIIIE